VALKNKPSPPRSNSVKDIAQQWLKLLKSIETELEDTGFSNVLWVDQIDGNDTTAERGSLVFKYATIQAALDNAQAGDVVWVSPGTYTEALTWPVDVDNVRLRGSGSLATIITTAAASPTITVAPTDIGVGSFAITDLAIANTNATQPCLSIDGTNDLNLGDNGRIQIDNVSLSNVHTVALAVSIVGSMDMNQIWRGNAGSFVFNQTGNIFINSATIDDVVTDNDPTGVEPNAGYGSVILNSTIAGDVTVSNIAQFVGTDDVQINDLTADLVDTAGGEFGSINFSGRITGDIAVTFDAVTATRLFLILDYARISGSFTFADAGGAGLFLGLCRAKHATFFNTDAGSIVAGSQSQVDLRMALFDQDSLDSVGATAGEIDRTHWVQTETAVTTGDDPITWSNAGGAIPYPTGVAPSFVGTEVPVKATGPVQVTAKTAAGCTLQTTVQGDVVLNALR